LSSVVVHPTAFVSPEAQLGAGVTVGPYCTVGGGAVLHDRVRLVSHVVVEGLTEIGADNIVHPFALLGGAPQHLAYKGEPTRLVIGPRNVIREHVTMHTGTEFGGGVTRVGSDGFFMVGCHVAHDCIVGDRVTMVNGSGLAGHVQIGDYVIIGGLAGVHQHVRIGRHAIVGAGALVVRDVIPYGSVWGNHAHLEGLNLVGLKRRGFTRETINDMRAAYRMLFADEGAFQERVDDVARVFAASPEVSEIVDFIRSDATRPLCLPSL
jgi:UDP-N-acetylglucosamine acyltransferase